MVITFKIHKLNSLENFNTFNSKHLLNEEKINDLFCLENASSMIRVFV